jgi:hypothetical protein
VQVRVAENPPGPVIVTVIFPVGVEIVPGLMSFTVTVHFSALPTSTSDGLQEIVIVSLRLLTVKERIPLVDETPFASVTVTVTVDVPSSDGVQARGSEFEEEHPVGSPCHTYE